MKGNFHDQFLGEGGTATCPLLPDRLGQITYPGGTLQSALTTGTNPSSAAFNPAGTRLYEVNYNSGSGGSVSVFDATSSFSLVTTVSVGNGASGIAIRPDGAFAYVPNTSDNSVSVINLSNNTIAATVSVPNGPDCAAVSPDGSICYVGTSAGIVPINTGTNTTGTTIDASHSVNAIATDGTNIYSVDSTGGVVRVVTIASGTVAHTITVGTNPTAIAYDRNLNRLYVANETSNNLSVISVGSMSVISTVTGFSGSGAPSSVAIASGGEAIYVGEQGTAKIQRVDPNSLTIVGAFTCNHTGVYAVAVAGNKYVVGSLYSNTEADAFLTNNSQFVFDAFGRCVEIIENGSSPSYGGNAVKQFIWCGNQRCEERDSSGNTVKQFFSLGENISGSNYFYTVDHLGSVREMTDGTGNLQSALSYDPYGRATQVAGTGTTPAFEYAGYYMHSRSGLNLTATRAYNAALGRFISRDSIQEAGGVNLYAYVDNEPINRFDPSGLGFQQAVVGAVGGAQVGGLVGAEVGLPAGGVGAIPGSAAGALGGAAIGALIGAVTPDPQSPTSGGYGGISGSTGDFMHAMAKAQRGRGNQENPWNKAAKEHCFAVRNAKAFHKCICDFLDAAAADPANQSKGDQCDINTAKKAVGCKPSRETR